MAALVRWTAPRPEMRALRARAARVEAMLAARRAVEAEADDEAAAEEDELRWAHLSPQAAVPSLLLSARGSCPLAAVR